MKLKVFLLIFIIFVSCKKEIAIDKSKTLPFYNTEDFTPEWIAKDDSKYKDIHTIAPFNFTNQNGEKVSNSTFKDKICVADFFFTTCPSICPTLAKNMSILQEKYKNDDDILLLSHSVMPWVDTVEKIEEYAETNNVIDNKWHMVTGNKDEIYSLARTSYFSDEDFKKTKDESEFIHTENFILVDKKGRIRGVYNGTLTLDVQRLQRHIEILKEE